MSEVLCIVGKSGSGKTRIAEELRKLGHKPLDSYTTRAKRSEDEVGHTFVSQEEFDALRGDFIAYTNFDFYEYAATREQFEEADVYIIDPYGVQELSLSVGREKFTVVYISTLEAQRYIRMANTRGRKEAARRIIHDEKKFDGFLDYDISFENNDEEDLDRIVKNLDWMIKQVKFSKGEDNGR